MRRKLVNLLLASSCCLWLGADWSQFRGPHGTSFAPQANLPTSWEEPDSVAWKVSLPGRGPASPIVVGNRVFVTCSSGSRQERLLVLAFDCETGTQLWKREFWATGRTLTHPFSAVAAPTPASDGQRLFTFFSSNDLVALDLDGNLLWYRGLTYDYPKAGNDAGMGSSPAVVGKTVVVQVENQGDSFVAGIDVETGETRWRLTRELSANWASPVAVPGTLGGKHVVLLQSRTALEARDAMTGDQLWRYPTGCSTVSSLAVSADRIFLPAEGLTMLDLVGDANSPRFGWAENRLQPDSASPMLGSEYVYVMKSAGVLACADPDTGKILWQKRIGGKHWSTPVIAGQRMYCFNQDGEARIVDLQQRGRVIASAEFGETILASPAVSEDALYIRSDRHLWKIAQR
jgi:outer membrane protein assembly factor BamB